MRACTALRIHLSDNAHTALMQFPGYRTMPRGETAVKVMTVLLPRKLFLCSLTRFLV